MKNIYFKLIITVFWFTTYSSSFSQGTNCSTADPFCSSTINFPNSTGVPNAGSVDCLGSTPNPAWYYMEIGQSGSITIGISQTNASGNGIDVDFILWGPYSSLSAACSSNLMSTSGVDCSFSPNPTETAVIPNAVSGQIYVLLLTNFSGQPGNITFSQTGGTGTTNCAVLCGVQSFTSVPTACNPSTNLYNVSGSLVINNPPTTGTLTITNSCGGSQVLNPPFVSPINYSFTGLTSNGNSCNVDAVFSADATCNTSASYTAPTSCTPICNISSVTANPSACNSTTNTYSLSGAVSFTNPPSTGTITLTSSCGGSTTLNPPFNSPMNYTISGIAANGSPCTVTATFSSNTNCTFTQNYTAPAPCTVNCNISQVTAGISNLDCTNALFDLTGTVTFSGAPASGTLTISSSCGGSQVFNAPFTSPQNYSITGLNANGSNCTITAVFSADPTCTNSTTLIYPITPTATATNNGPICEPGVINLFSNTVNGATYSWSGPNGYSSSQQNPIINPATSSESGVYTVSITLGGCTISDTTNVVINPTPVANAGIDFTVCSGDNIILTSNTVPNASYSWTGPNGFTSTQQNPTITNASTSNDGNYNLVVTVNGCSSSDIVNVSVSEVIASFSATPPSGLSPLDVIFNNTSVNGVSYSWSYGNGNTENTSSLVTNQEYIDNGTYVVTMVATNSDGCSDTATLLIDVYLDYFILIPNVFSPNSDNTNEVFKVLVEGADAIQVDIYDRWGLFMYGYSTLTGSWDGTKNGKDASEGTYYYVIKVIDSTSNEHVYTGHVTLER